MSSVPRHLLSFCGGITIAAIASLGARSGPPAQVADLVHDLPQEIATHDDTNPALVVADGTRTKTGLRTETPRVEHGVRLDREQIVDAKIVAATSAHDRRFESAGILPTKRSSGTPTFEARARALDLRGHAATKLRDWMLWKERVESDALRRSADYPPAERAKIFNAAAARIRRDLIQRFGAAKAQDISARIPLRRMEDSGAIHRSDARDGRMEQSDDAKDECDT